MTRLPTMKMRILAVILVLVVAAASTALWLITRTHQPAEVADQEGQVALDTFNPQPARFEWKACALLGRSAKDRSGFKRGSAQMYLASDGVWISVTLCDYGLAAQAGGELRRRLRGALRIVERRPNLDENGRKVGERVVALYKAHASVLATNKRLLTYIESSSLHHVLEFEKPGN